MLQWKKIVTSTTTTKVLNRAISFICNWDVTVEKCLCIHMQTISKIHVLLFFVNTEPNIYIGPEPNGKCGCSLFECHLFDGYLYIRHIFFKCATEYRKRIGPTLYFNIIQSKKNVQKKLEKHCEIYFWVIIQTKLARICGIINPGVLVMKDFTIKKNACIHMHYLCILGLDNKT